MAAKGLYSMIRFYSPRVEHGSIFQERLLLLPEALGFHARCMTGSGVRTRF